MVSTTTHTWRCAGKTLKPPSFKMRAHRGKYISVSEQGSPSLVLEENFTWVYLLFLFSFLSCLNDRPAEPRAFVVFVLHLLSLYNQLVSTFRFLLSANNGG